MMFEIVVRPDNVFGHELYEGYDAGDHYTISALHPDPIFSVHFAHAYVKRKVVIIKRQLLSEQVLTMY